MHVESSSTEIDGLGILDFSTKMEKDKTTRQVKGKINPLCKSLFVNEIIEGYEIHMGLNEYFSNNFLFENLETKEKDGLFSRDNRVWGTYIHGIFDNDLFRRRFLNYVRTEKGLKPLEQNIGFKYKQYKEDGFNKLAKILKENIDLTALLQIMKL